MAEAAGRLGLSVSQIYRLIAKLREHPGARSLVLNKSGPKPDARLLPDEIDQRIESAIDLVYKRRERPTVRKSLRDIQIDCRAASLKPPSRKAVQARLSARSPKELVHSREGVEAERQRFVPVKPGLRPEAPLMIVQIDRTKVDVQLVDERSRLVLGRPWLTVLLDVFSRAVVGLSLSFDAPSAAGVAVAVARAVSPKEDWLPRPKHRPWSRPGPPRPIAC